MGEALERVVSAAGCHADVQDEVDVVDVGGQHRGDEGADFVVAHADGVRIGDDVDRGGVAGHWGKEGGEEFCDFV